MLSHIMDWLRSGSPPVWEIAVGLVVYVHLEWWLGRTDKVKANSGLEALGNGLKRMLVHRIPLIGSILTAMASKENSQPQEPPK